jgi:predicted DNA-binding protein
MGRRRKEPTRVLSVRLTKKDYQRLKYLAERTGRTISEVWKELLRMRGMS